MIDLFETIIHFICSSDKATIKLIIIELKFAKNIDKWSFILLIKSERFFIDKKNSSVFCNFESFFSKYLYSRYAIRGCLYSFIYLCFILDEYVLLYKDNQWVNSELKSLIDYSLYYDFPNISIIVAVIFFPSILCILLSSNMLVNMIIIALSFF